MDEVTREMVRTAGKGHGDWPLGYLAPVRAVEALTRKEI